MQRTTLCLAILLGAMLQVSLVSGQTRSDLWGKDVEKKMVTVHGENMPILGFMGDLSDYLVKNRKKT